MRIAFVISSIDPSHGGEERDAFTLANGLNSRGENITLVTEKGAKRYLNENGPWDVVQGFGRFPLHTVYRVPGGPRSFYQKHTYAYLSPLPKLWKRLAIKNFIYQLQERKIFLNPQTYFVANSRRVKHEIQQEYQIPEVKISVVYPGVDIKQFNPEIRARLRRHSRTDRQLTENDFVIAFVGSGFRRKGLDYCLRMTAGLKSDGIPVKLLVAGRGTTNRYKRKALRLGLENSVQFLGPVSAISQVYAAADVFLLPSLYEPFGLAPLEAMACGLPVIVTADCGITELMTHDREGYLLEKPDAVTAGAAFLRELAQSPDKRHALGKHAAETAKKRSLDRYCDEMLDVYQRISGTFPTALSPTA